MLWSMNNIFNKFLFVFFVHCQTVFNNWKHPGHLKPFGYAGPFETVTEIDGYPDTKDFFQNYVAHMKPLKIKNACRSSPAFSLWSDLYLSSLRSLKNELVMVEIGKIEDRNKPIIDMSFLEFLQTYNDSNRYLVSSVPHALSSDILLPLPLQCPQIYLEHLLVNVMWMSSGGTASVVHVDSVDNIICLFRGSKQFVLIDPKKYSQQVLMEHPDEGYSDIDVHKVNYTKYFGLVNVSYHVVNLTAGDCLYVPYQWIHQVASYNSNIAVNIWWDHARNHLINLTECASRTDPSISLGQATFHGIRSSKLDDFKTELTRYLRKNLNKAQFFTVFLSEDEKITDLHSAAANELNQMFIIFDVNGDGIVGWDEVDNTSLKDWVRIESHFMNFEKLHLSSNKSQHSSHLKDEL